MTATIEGQLAAVFFFALAPGFAGLYQVNAIVPAGLAASINASVVLSVADKFSPPVTLPIQ